MSRVEIALPEAPWLEVPRSDDPSSWAEATARALCEGEDPAHAGPLAEELAVLARAAHAPDALLVAALVELPDLEEVGPFVLASLVVSDVACPHTADELCALLAERGDADVVAPTGSLLSLPAGQAARARSVRAHPGSGTVVEAVDVVLPLGDGTGVRLQLSWLALAAGEQLGALADLCAAGLRVLPG